MRLLRWSVPALLLALAAQAIGAPDQPVLEARLGAGGALREGRSACVLVVVRNASREIQGEIRVRPANSQTEWAQTCRAAPGAVLRFSQAVSAGRSGKFHADVSLIERGSGTGVASAAVQATPSRVKFLLGVVGSNSGFGLRTIARQQAGRLNKVLSIAVEDIPDSWEGLDPLDAIAIGGDDFAVLPPTVIAALRDWTVRGGTLIAIARGPRLAWDGSFVAKALGLSITDRSLAASVGAINRFARLSGDVPLDSVRALQRIDASTLQRDPLLGTRREALVAREMLGRGWVIFLSFDPSAPEVRAWEGWAPFWKGLLGGRLAAADDLDAPDETSMADPALVEAMTARFSPRPPVLAVLLAVLFYGLAIGPGDWLLLRALGKRQWTVLTFPLLVAAGTAAALAVTGFVRGSMTEVCELTIEDADPESGDSAIESWIGVYAPYESAMELSTSLRCFTREWAHEKDQPPGSQAPVSVVRPDGRVEGLWVEGMARFLKCSGTLSRQGPPVRVRLEERDAGTRTLMVRNMTDSALARCAVVRMGAHSRAAEVLVCQGGVQPGEERAYHTHAGSLIILPLGTWRRNLRFSLGDRPSRGRRDLRDLAEHMAFTTPQGLMESTPPSWDRAVTLPATLEWDTVFSAWMADPPPLLHGKAAGSRGTVLRWIRVPVGRE